MGTAPEKKKHSHPLPAHPREKNQQDFVTFLFFFTCRGMFSDSKKEEKKNIWATKYKTIGNDLFGRPFYLTCCFVSFLNVRNHHHK